MATKPSSPTRAMGRILVRRRMAVAERVSRPYDRPDLAPGGGKRLFEHQQAFTNLNSNGSVTSLGNVPKIANGNIDGCQQIDLVLVGQNRRADGEANNVAHCIVLSRITKTTLTDEWLSKLVAGSAHASSPKTLLVIADCSCCQPMSANRAGEFAVIF
jgi:hypothetical protein